MKNILITGGSEGLGRTIAETFAAQNSWRVCILGRNAVKTASVADSLGIEHVIADVTSFEALESSVQAVCEKMGKLAVLVNNAGVHIKGSFEDMHPDDIRQMVDVNLLGPMLTTRAYLPLLEENARIFNIGSYHGQHPAEGAPVYAAAKAGLGAFNEAFGKGLRRQGVSSTLVTIGALETDTQNELGVKTAQAGGLPAGNVAESLLYFANAPLSMSTEEIVLHGLGRWQHR
ncbi:MAG TPA: SDR family oxidoreductase [Candidatus Saccharimonadales bacterium]